MTISGTKLTSRELDEAATRILETADAAPQVTSAKKKKPAAKSPAAKKAPKAANAELLAAIAALAERVAAIDARTQPRRGMAPAQIADEPEDQEVNQGDDVPVADRGRGAQPVDDRPTTNARVGTAPTHNAVEYSPKPGGKQERRQLGVAWMHDDGRVVVRLDRDKKPTASKAVTVGGRLVDVYELTLFPAGGRPGAGDDTAY